MELTNEFYFRRLTASIFYGLVGLVMTGGWLVVAVSLIVDPPKIWTNFNFIIKGVVIFLFSSATIVFLVVGWMALLRGNFYWRTRQSPFWSFPPFYF